MAEPQHSEYLARISSRVGTDLQTILTRSNFVRNGYKVPESGSMPIGTGRRIRASILFLDISGFSNLPSEEADEQGVMLLSLSLLFSEFIRIIEDFGGIVEKNTGDGLMAYFTTSSEYKWSHETRALVAALYMLKASQQDVEPILAANQVSSLPIRVTINSGNVTIAEVGAKRGFRGIVAVGTAANVASKMLKAAAAGDLLIGANVITGLQQDLVQHLVLHSYSDQFFFRSNGEPYPYFSYTGRY